jgi:hypothetical protein
VVGVFIAFAKRKMVGVALPLSLLLFWCGIMILVQAGPALRRKQTHSPGPQDFWGLTIFFQVHHIKQCLSIIADRIKHEIALGLVACGCM